MPLKISVDKALLCGVCALFVWFFASSLSIAYHKAPQHDDAMFATIPKNFLNGYGWATSYGEKIPFNPDISTGPTLLIPALAMMAVFGNETWVPAITGALMNIMLTCLLCWQLWQLTKHRSAACLALLLAISVYAVNDFKTFTAYYTGSLLFLFALLLAMNSRYSPVYRSFAFGALAAIGLYAKPLILLSFLIAAPCLLVFEYRFCFKKYAKPALLMCVGFVLIFAPWQVYKKVTLSAFDPTYQAAYAGYEKQFFENHGTGIGQLKKSKNISTHLHLNTKKNYRILKNFLLKEYDTPVYVLLLVIAVAIFMAAKIYRSSPDPDSVEPSFLSTTFFSAILALVILGNLLWFVIFSFAMTPGHAFFLSFFSFFLLFVLIATLSRSNAVGIALCLLTLLFFQTRIPPLIEAYRFKVADIINNTEIRNTLQFLQTQGHRYPLASCGYRAAPYRMEYLLPQSQNFLDCYNTLEDSLARKADGSGYYWQDAPNFTFAIELPSFVSAMQSQGYVLEPIADVCKQHILFQDGFFVVCDVRFDEIRDRLDATKTAQYLLDYQNWYRTRIKVY